MSAHHVTEIRPAADARWDEFVAGHPDGIVYQHSGWLRSLEAEYGSELIALCCEGDDGALSGVLPLVSTRGVPLFRRSALLGPRLASLPRTPLAGPLTTDRASAEALLEAAVARTRERPGARLQIKRAAADLDGLADGLGGAPWRVSYVIDLPGEQGEVRFGNSRNHNRIKWAVNKARKEGVTVRDATGLDDIRAWYRLYLATMRDVLVPARPLRLFEAMWHELGSRGLMRLHLAEHTQGSRTVLIGGSIVLGLGRTAFYAFNGRLRSAFSLRPNEVIQWEAIHAAAESGYARYDLGEVVEGDVGLMEFKRKWGSSEVRFHRYYHPPPDPEDLHSADGSGGDGKVARAASVVWPRVPLAATRVAGDLAYRWL